MGESLSQPVSQGGVSLGLQTAAPGPGPSVSGAGPCCKLFSSSPGLHPLEANSTSLPSCDSPQCLYTFPHVPGG